MDYIHYQPTEDSYLTDDTDDEMELESIAIEYGNIEMIVDLDVMLQNETVQMTEAVDSIVEEIGAVSLYTSDRYKKYTQDQIERFICVKQEEGLSVPKSCAVVRHPSKYCI